MTAAQQCIDNIERIGDKRVPGVADKRGQAAADRLRDDARGQWRIGNRGAAGDWR